MKPEGIKNYCLSLHFTQYDFKEEWQAERGLIYGKMFLMLTHDKNGRPILSLKVNPEEGVDLRLSYPEIIKEGYYLNKRHWISIYQDVEFEPNLQVDLIKKSYELVLSSFSKKKLQELQSK